MLGSYWFLIIATIAAVGLSLLGLWLVRGKFDQEKLALGFEGRAAMLSLIGTLYAVVLGLVVVASLIKFEQARSAVEHEASALRDVFTMSEGLPGPLSNALRKRCLDYADTVANEEWPLMADGGRCAKADSIIEHLNFDVIRLVPANDGQSNIQEALLNSLNALADYRVARTALTHPAFDPIVWMLLISGATALIVFTYCFGGDNVRVQVLTTALVSMMLALNMVIVAMFAYPFSGDVRVMPVAFQTDFVNFQRALLESGQDNLPLPSRLP